MSTNTGIEWTDATWNPVRGCSRVSPGCVNCYAERQAGRFSKEGKPFHGFVKLTRSGPRWTGKVGLIEKHLRDPLHWKDPHMVFVNSMSDLFHEDLKPWEIDEVFDVMLQGDWHTYQILTKRSRAMYQYFDSSSNRSDYLTKAPWIWLGVSVEDRARLARMDDLRMIPAAVRFVSFEPLLEDLGHVDLSGIHWGIIGGESGPGARPFNLQWARDLIRQCRTANVAPFLKQLGAHPQEIAYPNAVTDSEAAKWQSDGWTRIVEQDGEHWRKYIRLEDRKGGEMAEWPNDVPRVREFPECPTQ